MSNEATVSAGLTISKGSRVYQSLPSSFQANVAGSAGPTPGSVLVATTGTDIDLSQLTARGGLCRLMNLDGTNYVTYGIWDYAASMFYALGELLPGETFVLRLSRVIGDDFSGGTTTPTTTNNRLHFQATGAACQVLVEAFDA